jgi:RNA polymerase sigma-70 factor (ECF subfamily)
MESDEELLGRVRGGDMRAFDALYVRYEGRLFTFLLRVLGQREEAEDVFHEALIQTLRNTHVPFQPGGFRLWLYRVAHNLARNRLRARARSTKNNFEIEAPPPVRTAEDEMDRAEVDRAMQHAVGRLPDRLAEVYHLRTSGLSYEEMADVLEIPLGTIKSRMHQMVDHLREELKPWIAR